MGCSDVGPVQRVDNARVVLTERQVLDQVGHVDLQEYINISLAFTVHLNDECSSPVVNYLHFFFKSQFASHLKMGISMGRSTKKCTK